MDKFFRTKSNDYAIDKLSNHTYTYRCMTLMHNPAYICIIFVTNKRTQMAIARIRLIRFVVSILAKIYNISAKCFG